jgi:hypothetical protein
MIARSLSVSINRSESLVADEGAQISRFEQQYRAREIMVLPRRQHQAEGIAQGIDERVDFGGQSFARMSARCYVGYRRERTKVNREILSNSRRRLSALEDRSGRASSQAPHELARSIRQGLPGLLAVAGRP